MTNQMKAMLTLAFGVYVASTIFSFVMLAVSMFSANVMLWIFFASSLCLSILAYVAIQKQKKKDLEFWARVKHVKNLIKMRELAIIAFYHRHGLEPVYLDGKLLDPDEFLGIVTKLDENNALMPSVYEMLNIEPRFSRSGNELPTFLIIKNIARKFKSKGLDNLKFKKLVNKKTLEKKSETEKKEKKDEKANDKKKSQVKKGASSKIKFKPVSPLRYAITKFTPKKITKFKAPKFKKRSFMGYNYAFAPKGGTKPTTDNKIKVAATTPAVTAAEPTTREIDYRQPLREEINSSPRPAEPRKERSFDGFEANLE